jgi:putative spermidine/putrescine transport system substrate-binding protein
MIRKANKTVFMAVALLLSAGVTSQSAQQTLQMASWGGIFKEATQKNIADPFTKETGIPVSIADVGGGWAAKIEAQKAAGQLQWDIIDSIDAGSAAYLDAHWHARALPRRS